MKTWSDFNIDLPGTEFSDEKYLTCPECSHTRKKKNDKCLSVNGDKKVWKCNHCGFSGGLKQGRDASGYSGQGKSKIFVKPRYELSPGLPQNAIDYFKGRGISESVLSRNRVGCGPAFMPQTGQNEQTIQFPYHHKGLVVNVKYRTFDKQFKTEKDAERIFYGIDDIQGHDTAIIVEGEIDKLSLEMAGFINVISVPDGAPSTNTKNYDSKFEFLESASDIFQTLKTVILAVDNDGPGKLLEEELSRRTGREKCKRVQWPDGCKDANEVLVKHGAECLKLCIENASDYPIKGLFSFQSIESSIVKLYDEGHKGGVDPGWESLKQYYTVRPGEWTLVTGIPSHGKSEFVDALMVNLTRNHAWKFGIYSPENQPLERHAAKLIEKFSGVPFANGPRMRIERKKLEADIYMLDPFFNFILPGDEQDQTIDTILELTKVLVFRKGIKGLVIDPWNEIEHNRPQNMTETEYISLTLTKIRRFARSHDIHIWVVAHPTKLIKDKNGNYPVPTPYDVSGSAHWRNKADNCLAVWRDLQNPNSPVQVHIQKIRFRENGKVGMVELNYDFITGRYTE